MRIQLLSDLHLELGSYEFIDANADVIVFAGDVHSGIEGLRWIRTTIPDKPVIYICGNHEFYGYTLGQLVEQLKFEAAGTNVHVLENDVVDLNDVAFLGCTLWTDYALLGRSPDGSIRAEQRMRDFDLIRCRPNYRRIRAFDLQQLHVASTAWLGQQVAALAQRKLVVVTHHAPSRRSLSSAFGRDPIAPAYASALDEFVAQSGAAAWCHGHTHYCIDYTIGETRVVSNQRGYPGRGVPGFREDFIIEV